MRTYRRPSATTLACLALTTGATLLVLATARLAPRPVAARALAGDPSTPGPRAVATAQVQYTSGGATALVDVYYPNDGPPGPAVVILPSGYTGGPENHAGHGRHLASWGYVVGVVHDVSIIDPSDIAPNAARASAALDALRAAPALAGRLTDRAAVVGAHFNGLSALQAAVDDPRFRAVVGLHAATLPLSGVDLTVNRVPYLALGGGSVSGGLLCLYGTTWQDTYFDARSIHRAGFVFADAHPSDFLDPPPTDPFDFCGQPRAKPFAWITGLMTAWLDYYVRGDMAAYRWLYTADGAPARPAEVSDSQAANAPQRLTALPAGSDGLTARLTWRLVMSDTTALDDQAVLRARGDGAFSQVAVVPLPTAAYDDAGLEAGVTYRYTVAYRDRSGRLFQTAEPKSLVAGGPTVTPSPTLRPTYTPRPTNTVAPTATPSPTRTATSPPSPSPTVTPTAAASATAVVEEHFAYLPRAAKGVP